MSHPTSFGSWFQAKCAPLFLLLAFSCGGRALKDPSGVSSEPVGASRKSASEHAESNPSPARSVFEVNPILAEVLAEAGFRGAIALYDEKSRQLSCSAEEACDVPLGPASTFKIPHTLIGLQLGELESTEHIFKWDGREYSMQAWNQDHTLRSAMEVSCVPCFQQLARKIGEERMTRALQDLAYGNATLGGPIDEFWLEAGGLRITPREQLDFLYRLRTRALPFRPQAMDATIEVIPKTVFRAKTEAVLRGKTGLILDPDVGWYVGWLEWHGGTTYFATALTGDNDRTKLLEARRALTVEALRRYTKESLIEQ